MATLKERVRRKALRLYLRIVHEKATPEYIARGWAIGMFYGCLIPFGLQLALSIPTAFLLKGSKVGATLGTLITNHFTIFIIYPAQCFIGGRLLGYSHAYADIERALASVVREQSFEALMAIGGELIAAFFLGGILLTALATPLTYFGVLVMVRRHRVHIARKKAIRKAIRNSR